MNECTCADAIVVEGRAGAGGHARAIVRREAAKAHFIELGDPRWEKPVSPRQALGAAGARAAGLAVGLAGCRRERSSTRELGLVRERASVC